MDDLRNIIIFSGCVDKALCGDVVKMTKNIEKLILRREVEASIITARNAPYLIINGEVVSKVEYIMKLEKRIKEINNG